MALFARLWTVPVGACAVLLVSSFFASADDPSASAPTIRMAAATTDAAPSVNLPPSPTCLKILNSADPQPPPDLDTLRQQVLTLFTNKCAKCHQFDQAHPERIIKKYNFILNISLMEGTSKYIVPGDPAGSDLFTKICTGEMPKRDDSQDLSDLNAFANSIVTEAEMRSVRQWIVALDSAPAAASNNPPSPPPSPPAEVAPPKVLADQGGAKSVAAPPQKPPFVSDADIYDFISSDLNRCLEATPDNCKNYRYLTLTHLFNAGVSSETIALYRRAVFKLLNALSQRQEIFAPQKIEDFPLGTVDPYGTIIRVDIDALNWITDKGNKWDDVAQHSPYSFEPNRVTPLLSIQQLTNSDIPVLRADWFVKVASEPPLYYDILGLPDTLDDLETSLNVHRLEDIRSLSPSRISRDAFTSSGVSEFNRLIERHTGLNGFYWISYDFGSADPAKQKDLERFPLGPDGTFANIPGFVHDGGEVIYRLPNGMHAYYLTRANGQRLEIGPPNIVQDNATNRADKSIIAGISCMNCHAGGLRPPAFPATRIKERPDMSQDERKDFRELYPGAPAIDALIARDTRAYLETLAEAGAIEGNGDTNRPVEDPVNALVDAFDQSPTIELAAAELGLTPEDFKNLVDQAPQNVNGMSVKADFARLRPKADKTGSGQLSRQQFVSLYREFVQVLKLGEPIKLDPVRDPLPASSIPPAPGGQTPPTPPTPLAGTAPAPAPAPTPTPAPTPVVQPPLPATDPNKDYCEAPASTENARQAGISGLTNYVQKCAAIAPDIVPGIRAEIAELGAYQTASACLAAGNVCTNGAACLSAYVSAFPGGPHRSELQTTWTNRQGDCLELPNGSYTGYRGYNSPNGSLCLGSYPSFSVEVEDGTISFDSDIFHWDGSVNQKTGEVDIEWGDITGSNGGPKTETHIRGNYQNAQFFNGRCGSGYFRMSK